MAGLTNSAIAVLEAENRRLREALVFAERGWRDALAFASSQQPGAQLSKPEDVLEIKSLQHETNMLQRQILKRAQMADEFQRALSFSAEELEETTNQLMVCLHAEVAIGKTNYAPPLWTVDFPSDSEVSSNTQLTRLGRLMRKLQAVVDWAKEHNLEKFPHYESILKELDPHTQKDVLPEEMTSKNDEKKLPKKIKKKIAAAKKVDDDAASVKSRGSRNAQNVAKGVAGRGSR